MSLIGVFLLGALVGAVALVVLFGFLVNTDEGQRRQARVHAEQRVRDAQTMAMLAMADATERAVAGSASGHGWPSEVIDGTVVETTTAED